jgi:hypothetical protein
MRRKTLTGGAGLVGCFAKPISLSVRADKVCALFRQTSNVVMNSRKAFDKNPYGLA